MSARGGRYGLLHTLRCLWRGQSLLRILMNARLSAYTLKGRTVDIGGGHSPDYFSYLQRDPDVSVDMIDGSKDPIDFEQDPLPYGPGAADTVLLCNVLEHIYNYRFLLGEVKRILAPGGQLIGFVPFWIGYHPDPHDYFRYTHEALMRILSDAGFAHARIEPLAAGPLLANFNTIVLSVPRVLRPAAYLGYAAGNAFFLKLRPGSARRNPLGYVFTARV